MSLAGVVHVAAEVGDSLGHVGACPCAEMDERGNGTAVPLLFVCHRPPLRLVRALCLAQLGGGRHGRVLVVSLVHAGLEQQSLEGSPLRDGEPSVGFVIEHLAPQAVTDVLHVAQVKFSL